MRKWYSFHRGVALQVVNETLPALHKLKQSGVVRHIGITGLPLKIFPAVLDRWDISTLSWQHPICQ